MHPTRSVEVSQSRIRIPTPARHPAAPPPRKAPAFVRAGTRPSPSPFCPLRPSCPESLATAAELKVTAINTSRSFTHVG